MLEINGICGLRSMPIFQLTAKLCISCKFFAKWLLAPSSGQFKAPWFYFTGHGSDEYRSEPLICFIMNY
jgi:hypothetical protein